MATAARRVATAETEARPRPGFAAAENRGEPARRAGAMRDPEGHRTYHPEWLDNLADDVTLEAAAMDGTAQGSENVRSIVVTAKELYEHQEFKFAGPVGDYGFLEDYTTQVRGEHISVIVAVAFNAAGQTQHVVVNHRPRRRTSEQPRLNIWIH
jgi:hypothetical protein